MDFTIIDNEAAKLINMYPRTSNNCLETIRKFLNKSFKESYCEEILYTQNDKLFFGMCVFPVVTHMYVADIAKPTKLKPFEKYFIEFDSQIFSGKFSPKEITAMLLHEFGHIIYNTYIQRELKDAVTVQINRGAIEFNDENIDVDAKYYSFGIQRALRKLGSMFCITDKNELIADEFVIKFGYGAELISAFDTINSSIIPDYHANSKNKLASLMWVFSTKNKLGLRRNYILDTIDDERKSTPSVLLRNFYKSVIKDISISRTTTSGLVSSVNEGILDKLKYNDLKNYESDLYVYTIKVKNIEDEVEALGLVRELNFKIEMLSEYLGKINKQSYEFNKYSNLLIQYINLREKVTDNPRYTNKMYGLFVKYPELT